MRCDNCNYKWKPRVDKPKECPRCKQRLDMLKEEIPIKEEDVEIKW